MSLRELTVPLAALGGALALAALAVVAAGLDPWQALRELASGAAGDRTRIALTLARAAPLVLTGLAVALAFRAGLWNIGAEGQLLAGALAAAWVGTRAEPLPGGPLLPLLAGVLAGAAWGAIAGALRAGRGVPEVIATILLNFIAIELLSWSVQGPLRERAGQYPQTDAVPAGAMLGGWGPVPADLVLGIALAVLLHVALGRTRGGLALRATGLNPLAARAAGVQVSRLTLLTLAGSGALAGLAGAGELQGRLGRLYEGYAPGHGYSAIAVALLARLQPLAVVPAALAFGALAAGGERMQARAGVPAAVGVLVQALVILASVVAWRRALASAR